MRWTKLVAGSVCAFALSANAANIESTYTPLGGTHWSVAFAVTNNGDPAPINEFTVFFSEALFSNLSLAGSPSTWDSIVIQPDLGIPAAGFFDALVFDPVDALDVGGSQSGFAVDFEFLGQGAPGSLPFDILDANFQVISSGRTTVLGGGTVPEPATWGLAAIAIYATSFVRRRISN